MQFVSIRVITTKVANLLPFYEQLTGIKGTVYTQDFAEIKTSQGTLAIASIQTLSLFGAEQVAKAAQNQSAIIEFRVTDLEALYQRLQEFLSPYIVQPPTLMPWGNQSLLLQDPDGNLVNLFMPVTKQAIQKQQ